VPVEQRRHLYFLEPTWQIARLNQDRACLAVFWGVRFDSCSRRIRWASRRMMAFSHLHGVPEPRRAVSRGGDDARAVRVEGREAESDLVLQEDGDLTARG